jgi:hypothetical protein
VSGLGLGGLGLGWSPLSQEAKRMNGNKNKKNNFFIETSVFKIIINEQIIINKLPLLVRLFGIRPCFVGLCRAGTSADSHPMNCLAGANGY